MPPVTGGASVVMRPRKLRRQVTIWTIVLPLVTVLIWLALPKEATSVFRVGQLVEVIILWIVLLIPMWILSSAFVKADAEALQFRNAFATHRVPWSEVEGFRFNEHDSFANVFLAGDIGRRAMIGIQRVDGDKARAAVQGLRDLWEASKAS